MFALRRAVPAMGVSAALLTAAVATAGGATTTPTVVIQHMAFSPSIVRIHPGQSVEFMWRDGSIPHNVTSHWFKGSRTQTTGTFTVHFTRKGVYYYYCSIHPSMKGEVIVS